MRIDLHTHSNRSDGTDTPAELVRKAAGVAELDVVALTDHDATVGWDEAQRTADEVGIRLVPGIEISTTFQGRSVHLLGYDFDPAHAGLVAELEKVRDGRDQRLPRMLEKLAALGYPLTLDDVLAQSGSAAASGRPHIADAMIAKGYIVDRSEAFDGLLNTGGQAYVGRYSAPLVETIGLVAAAGGVTVVAHPWSRDSRAVLTPDVFATLVAAGLGGLEADHNDHDAAARDGLREIAADLDLAVTGSSDYHGTGKSEAFFLGCNTTAPEQLEKLLAR